MDDHTELRIHGVAGGAPESVLFPAPVPVVSDDLGVSVYEPFPEVVSGIRRQAYIWGNLTSGGRSRAFWLLLLPFALSNIAFFMTPRCQSPSKERGRSLRRLIDMQHRWFALALTGTMITAIAAASMDIVAWQSVRTTEVSAFPPVRWLITIAAGDVSLRLAIASLCPLIVLVALWRMAHLTWTRLDRYGPPARPDGTRNSAHGTDRRGAPSDPDVLLAQPGLWNGGDPVGRMRSLHVAIGFAVISLMMTAPFTSHPPFSALGILELFVLVTTVALAAHPEVAKRYEPGDEPVGLKLLDLGCRLVRDVATVGYGAAFASLATAGPPPPSEDALPGSHAIQAGLFLAQVVLLSAIAVMTLVLARITAGASRAAGPALSYGRAMRGLAAPVTLLLAWMLAKGFAIGLAFTVAEVVGRPSYFAGTRADSEAIVLPAAHWWAAPAGLVTLIVIVAITGSLLLLGNRAAKAPLPGKQAEDPGEKVRRAWAIAELTDRGGLVLTALALVAVLAIITVGVTTVTAEKPLEGWVIALSVAVLIGFTAGLLLLGWQAYSNTALRRTVGVLWDVSTFWPRATHPLAPPCYAERVIPELVGHVRALLSNGDGRVVISGHSQGSVIAAALILQVDPALRTRTRLLTHGSPLCRLYARYFPAYFGPDAIEAIRKGLLDPARPDEAPWRNLYRRTDPIGGAILTGANGVDLYLRDPERDGEPIRGHSDYYVDAAYAGVLAGWIVNPSPPPQPRE
ncbi:lipase family protein [Nonomuraea zeae]|uniref:Lipase family protein n=1 Tax=Nonomuraea zeae TaxID=1642303 RepID=A0A5S4GYF5_9ACTN|nr:lipase family protein [Nonomuraea zeae]TMR37494.1 lipase family protein [Nonomuraea zeae]